MKRRPRQFVPDPPPPGLPIVAVVGRPNVGKSTLFNRLTGTRRAAVIDTPGITRDRQYARAEWGGRSFVVVDTGGYDPEPGANAIPLNEEIKEQALLAIEEADVVVFLLDVTVEAHPVDRQLADILRRTQQPVVVAVNKCEQLARFHGAHAFSQLGLGEVFPVSALHGTGTGELLDRVVDLLPEAEEAEDEEQEGGDDADRPIRLAIVGRQNVGKSTLVNRLLGRERVIASPLAGTTRDAIDTAHTTPDGRRWVLIDTAGIRRRGKIDRGIEGLSVLSSLMSMERADVVCLLIDGTEGMTDQDKHIAGYAVERGCSLFVGVNKWDAVEKDHRTADQFVKELRNEVGFLEFAPVLFLSALSGQRADKVWTLAGEIFDEASRRIETRKLNEWLAAATTRHSPPIRANRQLKANYVTQTGVRPPTFSIFCNDPKLVHFSYARYLVNSLREEFGLGRVPIRLRLRRKSVDRFAEAGPRDPAAPRTTKVRRGRR